MNINRCTVCLASPSILSLFASVIIQTSSSFQCIIIIITIESCQHIMLMLLPLMEVINRYLHWNSRLYKDYFGCSYSQYSSRCWSKFLLYRTWKRYAHLTYYTRFAQKLLLRSCVYSFLILQRFLFSGRNIIVNYYSYEVGTDTLSPLSVLGELELTGEWHWLLAMSISHERNCALPRQVASKPSR